MIAVRFVCVIAAAGAAAGLAGQARADIISATVVNYGAVPAVSDSFGTLETALNFGGVTTTNNTIVFLGTTVSGDPQSATVASTPFDVVIATVSGQSLRNDTTIATDPLFGSEIWSTSQQNMTLTVSGLNAGQTYQFQYLHGDTRGIVYNNGTITFTDSSGNSVNRQLSFGSSGSNYAIVTVEVSGTTSLSYAMPPTSGRGPSYSGMAVSAVPEPAMPLLGAAGLAGFLAATRRGRVSRHRASRR